MWIIKTHGESFYVNHVSAEIPWSTKETPDNSHTKGSIKFKECLLTIDDDNCATISKLSLFDKVRLRNQRLGISRIIFHSTSFGNTLKEEGVRHSPFKVIHGACSSAYTVCDLLDSEMVTYLLLKYGDKFRILMPNETQYRAYDDKSLWSKLQNDYMEGDDEDDDE
jgi:hypothetical protein